MSPTYEAPEGGSNHLAPLGQLADWIGSTTLHVVLGILLGWGVARLMRSHQLNWTWAGLALLGWVILRPLFGGLGLTLGVAALAAAGRGRRWRREDLEAGGDLAQIVRSFQGPLDAVRALNGKATVQRLLNRRASWFLRDEVLIGQDVRDGGLVRIPLGGATGGTHTLVLGAAGSGKTVTMTGIAVHGVEHGMGAVLVDPKDDPKMLEHARDVAERMGRPFVHWTPQGSVLYNPYAHGSDTEIADKLLAGEQWSEPHYLRQAQRYIGHEVRALREAGVVVSLANVVRYLDPGELDRVVRFSAEGAGREGHGLSAVSDPCPGDWSVGRPRPAGGVGGVRRWAVARSGDPGGGFLRSAPDDRAASGRVLQPRVRSQTVACADAGRRDSAGPAERRGEAARSADTDRGGDRRVRSAGRQAGGGLVRARARGRHQPDAGHPGARGSARAGTGAVARPGDGQPDVADRPPPGGARQRHVDRRSGGHAGRMVDEHQQ